MFYVVDNTDNIQRKIAGKKSRYWDDCGAYCSNASYSNFHYKYNEYGQLVFLKRVKGLFVTRKTEGGKTECTPIMPQPQLSELIYVTRRYDILKLSKDFTRRITYITALPMKADGKPLNIALYEYRGPFPGHTKHGSSREEKGVYQQTEPRIRDGMESLLSQNVSPRQVYAQMIVDDDQDEFAAPRDTKQARRVKYMTDRKGRSDAAVQNFADQIQYLASLASGGDNFVQTVIHENGKVPSIILYTQMTIEILQNCCTGIDRVVLGVDRTFSLAELYVTVMSFKHPRLLRKTTNDNPVLIGPILLHGTCTHAIYCHLFAKLASILPEISISNLVIGSDEELAIRKAIREALPNSTNVICIRHVNENVIRQLQNKVGLSESDRRRVLHFIFGTDGIVSTSDVDVFDGKMTELKEMVAGLANNDSFNSYVDSTLAEALLNGIIKPSQRCSLSAWTNNNCESINHVLKSAVNWKTLQLTKLVDELRSLVATQKKDIANAIIGQGNYYLSPHAQHYSVTPYEWQELSPNSRQRKVMDFIKDRKTSRNMVQSSDGTLNVLQSPCGGRKPGQQKRKKCAKTTTVKTARISQVDENNGSD